ALADVLVTKQIPEEARERHRGRRGGAARTFGELGEGGGLGLLQRLRPNDPPWHEAAERAAALDHVPHLGRVRPRVVVGRVFGELVVRDRELEPVAEDLQLFEAHLLRLMRYVASLDR